MARVSGILFIKIDGVQRQAIGDFTYNLGLPKKEMVIGADEIHGYMERPQVAFIEGEIRDQSELSVGALRQIVDGTVHPRARERQERRCCAIASKPATATSGPRMRT